MGRFRATCLFVAAVLLTGCTGSDSGSDPVPNRTATVDLKAASAAQLLAEARRAGMVAGEFKADGKSVDAGVTTEVTIAFEGDEATGVLSTGGVRADMLRLKGYDFVRGPDSFWKGILPEPTPDILAEVRGKWVSFEDTSTTFASVAALLGRSSYVNRFIVMSKDVRKAPDASLDGVDCYVLKDTAGTLYLAKDNARPVRAVDAKGGTVRYSYSDVVLPAPPLDTDLILDSRLGLH